MEDDFLCVVWQAVKTNPTGRVLKETKPGISNSDIDSSSPSIAKSTDNKTEPHQFISLT